MYISFQKACQPGKEGPRFALIMPGLGITLMAFNQTTQDPTQMYAVQSVCTTWPLFPGLRPHVQKRKSHGQPLRGCSWGQGRVICFHSLLGVASLPPPKCKVLSRPRHASREPDSLGPGGQVEPLAVRLYGPPLRPAEASPGQREESRREQRCRLRADPSARLSRPHLLHTVAWCENASPGRTGAAASAAAARAVGGGRGGGAEVRGGGG